MSIRSCDLAPSPASIVFIPLASKLVKWHTLNGVQLTAVSSLHAAPDKCFIFLLPLQFSTSLSFLFPALSCAITSSGGFSVLLLHISMDILFFICYVPCVNICIKKIIEISIFLTWGVLCAILSSICSGNPPSFLLITALETWLVYQWSNHTHFKINFFFFLPIRYWEMVDCSFSKLQELV